MARYRITYFFGSRIGPGWSESIHTTYTSVTAIGNLITRYTILRRPFLADENRIISIRVSDDEIFRDILLFPTGLPCAGQAAGVAAPLFVTANLRLLAQRIYVRNFYTRGHTSDMFTGNDFNLASPSYRALLAFSNFLKGAGIGLAHQSSPQTAFLVQAYNTSTGLFTVDPAFGTLAINTPVTITRVPRSLVAARNWRVASAPAAGQFTLQQWPLAVNVAGFGRVRNGTPVVDSIDDCVIDDVGERKVGRPFGLPRGRAPVVR